MGERSRTEKGIIGPLWPRPDGRGWAGACMLSAMSIAVPRRILPVIVLSQFAGTSLWFAVNAVMPDLQQAWGLPLGSVGLLTSAVQLGFVTGTLVFALLMLADRFEPPKVFLACSLLGAALNAATLFADGRLA